MLSLRDHTKKICLTLISRKNGLVERFENFNVAFMIYEWVEMKTSLCSELLSRVKEAVKFGNKKHVNINTKPFHAQLICFIVSHDSIFFVAFPLGLFYTVDQIVFENIYFKFQLAIAWCAMCFYRYACLFVHWI